MAPKKKGPSMRTQQQRKLQMQKIAKGGPQLSGTKGVGLKPAAAPKATSKSMAQANPTRLPNSARAGDNLPSRGASQLRTSRPSKPIGTGKGGVSKPSGSSMKADAKAWQRLNQTASAKSAKAAEPRPRTPAPGTGNVERQAIERGRATRAAQGAKQAMGRMSGTLSRARFARGPASAIASVAADAALGPLATKAGQALGRALKPAARKLDDALPGVNSKDEARRRRAQAAAKGSTSRFKGAREAAVKKASAIKGSPVVGPRKSGASSFDSSFAAARKAGKSTFTWRGKKYNTKLRGEK